MLNTSGRVQSILPLNLYERIDFNMAEFVANASQTVATNQNVIFTDTVICGKSCIVHRNDSGLVTVKGASNRARYKVFFSGNISIPATGTVESISLAIAVAGEPIQSALMISTPTATESINNVSTEIIVEIPCNCCETISVKNTSTQDILVQNANLIVERVA